MTAEDFTGDGLPVVDADALAAATSDNLGDENVAGVLLAAGDGDRFEGGNKLLADLDGEPLVRHAARTLTGASLDRVVAVVGHEADRVRGTLADLPLTVVENQDYERGQATSVRTGLHALAGADVDPDAVVFALGDMPRVEPDTVDRLVAAFGAGLGDPLAAAHGSQRGNPVLFGAGFVDRLADVEGDTGGRQLLLESNSAALVETGDPGVRQDVDSRADLERLRGR